MNKIYRRIYLKHKLKWIQQRRKSLNQIEDKLQQMRELAQYVRDNNPTPAENELIDKTFQKLKTDIKTLDQESKIQMAFIKEIN